MSIIKKWDIKNEEGDKFIGNIISKLSFFKKINKDEMPLLFKKMSKEDNIKITKNGKRRNINNYIKFRYNSYDNMLKSINPAFYKINFSNIHWKNNYITRSILDNDYNKKNEENDNNSDDNTGKNPNVLEIIMLFAGITGLFYIFMKRIR